MQKGLVSIAIDGIYITDYEAHWEGKPIFVFMRSVFDKYIYKTLTGGHQAGLVKDVDELKSLIKSFFNLYKQK